MANHVNPDQSMLMDPVNKIQVINTVDPVQLMAGNLKMLAGNLKILAGNLKFGRETNFTSCKLLQIRFFTENEFRRLFSRTIAFILKY